MDRRYALLALLACRRHHPTIFQNIGTPRRLACCPLLISQAPRSSKRSILSPAGARRHPAARTHENGRLQHPRRLSDAARTMRGATLGLRWVKRGMQMRRTSASRAPLLLLVFNRALPFLHRGSARNMGWRSVGAGGEAEAERGSARDFWLPFRAQLNACGRWRCAQASAVGEGAACALLEFVECKYVFE